MRSIFPCTRAQRAHPLRALACVLVAGGALAVGSARAQDDAPDADDRVVAVTGVGRVTAAPDQAVVSLGATVQRDDARDAQRELDAVMQAALRSIRALGIASEKLQTAGLSLTPVYAEIEPRQPSADAARRRDEPRIAAYRATNIVRVTVDDLAMVGAVVDAGIGAGVNEIRGVSFGLADDLPFRITALERAVEAARRKALAAAAALGVGLGEPVEIRERGSATPYPEVAFARSAAAPVEAGELVIEVTVDATFALGPRRAEPAAN